MSRIVISAIGYDATETKAWEDYVTAHADATIYHSLAWRTIFERSFGYHSWLLVARDTVEGHVVGVLPLYRVATPFSSRLVSVPFRDRGGPLWSSEDAFDALIARAKELLTSTGAAYVHLKSLRPWPSPAVQRNGLTETMHWMRSVVPLQGINAEALWKRIGTKTRNMVRQAEANGLKFADITDTADACSDWYRLHLLTQKRLGVPPFSRKFFELMIRELGKAGTVRVYCVQRDGVPLAAMLLLCHRDVAIYGYSASSAEAQRLRANDLMLYRAICKIVEDGFACFDMGSDAPSQDSLLFFKRKWGAAQHAIPSYTFGKANLALTDSTSSHYALARKMFSQLPTGVTAVVGSWATRFFG
ncbi:MAG: GNAT family N-acetyltransferase [Betaproteobacteria bacterium]|nr:GNAT family N-acetyltransferase [Betaproteobacteria bacterium]